MYRNVPRRAPVRVACPSSVPAAAVICARREERRCHPGLPPTSVGSTEFGEAEVEQRCASRREHDVGRLQIAMDDSMEVRVIERAADLDGISERFVERHSPILQPRCQRFTLEVLHDEEIDLTMTPDVEERADVRVHQRGNCPRFPCEAGAMLRIERGTCREDLDCYGAVQTGIGGAKHFSHTADAENVFDAVGSERRAGDEARQLSEQRCAERPHTTVDDRARRVQSQE